VEQVERDGQLFNKNTLNAPEAVRAKLDAILKGEYQEKARLYILQEDEEALNELLEEYQNQFQEELMIKANNVELDQSAGEVFVGEEKIPSKYEMTVDEYKELYMQALEEQMSNQRRK